MKLLHLFITFIVLSALSCSSAYRGKDVYGAEEFVLDSYKIKGGKFSILEMEGNISTPLSNSLLEEYQDTIYEDDVLEIEIYHPKRKDMCGSLKSLSNSVGFRVLDGYISLPDLDPIKVRGLTIKEAIVAEAKKPEFLNAFSIDPNKKSKEFKEEDERLKKVNEVFSKYRTAAYKQLELEYPILVEQREETKYRNRLKRYGVPDSPEQRKKYKEQVIGRLVSEMPIEEHMKKQPDTRLKELLQKTPYAPVTLD